MAALKAQAAADSLKQIWPSVQATAHRVGIPMPGHAVPERLDLDRVTLLDVEETTLRLALPAVRARAGHGQPHRRRRVLAVRPRPVRPRARQRDLRGVPAGTVIACGVYEVRKTLHLCI